MQLSELLHADLVAPRGSQRVAWLVAEPETDPPTLAGRRRQRRRLTRTTRAEARQARHEQRAVRAST
jgi:hypothetical protein